MSLRMTDEMDDLETCTSTELQDRISELMNRVSYGGERIVLTRHGKPIAAIVGIKDLERLRTLETAERAP